MKIFTVHLRHNPGTARLDVKLVKEGFNWPAFFFTLIWALVKQCWWVLLGFVLLSMTVNGFLAHFGANSSVQTIISLGFNVVFGFLANDLIRWTLSRSGFSQEGVVSGEDGETALKRLLEERPELAMEIVR